MKQNLEKFVTNIGISSSRELYPEYCDNTNQAWELIRTILCRWRKEVSCPIVLAPIPWYLHYTNPATYPSNAYRSRFLELTSSGFAFFDCMPSFLKYSSLERDNFVYEYDKHFTQLGHKAFGDALTKFLINTRVL